MLIELQAAKNLFLRTSARPWSLCIFYIRLSLPFCSPESRQQTFVCHQQRGICRLYQLCFDQLWSLMPFIPDLLCVCSLEYVKPLFVPQSTSKPSLQSQYGHGIVQMVCGRWHKPRPSSQLGHGRKSASKKLLQLPKWALCKSGR